MKIKVNCVAWKAEECEIEKLQEIYNNEINFEISCFWDGGFTVKLGDNMNGFIWEDTFDTLMDAITALIKTYQGFKIKDGKCKNCYAYQYDEKYGDICTSPVCIKEYDYDPETRMWTPKKKEDEK